MTFDLCFHGVGAVVGAILAAGVGWRDRGSFVQRTFALGMAALAVEAALTAAASLAGAEPDQLAAQRRRLLATALLPGPWLLFSLSFARYDHRAFLTRWRPAIAALFAGPVLLAWAGGRWAYSGADLLPPDRWLLRLGGAGYAFHLLFLAGAVLVLANLERTLRASAGSMRWFIKYMVLGVGGLFAARVYTSSQALLFRAADTGLHLVDTAALIAAAVLVAVSLARSRLRDADVYVSQSVLYNSLTALFVGIYLLVVGLLAKAVAWFGGGGGGSGGTCGVLVFFLGLSVLLLSDRLQQHVRGFVRRNFRRPQYDYRREWMAFSRATGTLLDTRALCAAVAGRVSETLRVPSVTVWLREEGGSAGQIALGGSTAYSEREGAAWAARHGRALVRLLGDREGPLDLHERAEPASDLPRAEPASDLPRAADTRYAIALHAGGEELGCMVLGGRPGREPLSEEDLDLLTTLADQAAGHILRLRLSERLVRSREMEAFQALSAFFVHDLKNLASKLSLTLQNLPAHFDDPEFRGDLLATIERSVARINEMCGRLSPLSRTLELRRTPSDLGEVVAGVLEGFDAAAKADLEQDLRPTPLAAMDVQQIQKVVLNLVLNASEAVGQGGHIRVATGQSEGWVYVSVSDDGCGMSREFMARSLFKPFHTTKRQGLGIGLFHSKTIVEAHRGRLEVESEEGRGTTFRVLLPVAERQPRDRATSDRSGARA